MVIFAVPDLRALSLKSLEPKSLQIVEVSNHDFRILFAKFCNVFVKIKRCINTRLLDHTC